MPFANFVLSKTIWMTRRALSSRVFTRTMRATDYKLTFEHDYQERAEEYDDEGLFLESALHVVQAIATEAYEAVEVEVVVVDAA